MRAQEMVQELRDLGMSQIEIAHRTGLSQGAVSHIMKGRRKDVRISTFTKLADLLLEIRKTKSSQSSNN